MKTAQYWSRTATGSIRCELCPHHCVLAEAKTGVCGVRGVRDGELKAMGYGQVSSAAMDPIEKKPLYHFFPGRTIFSVGGWGCNLACVFCQNWGISQRVEAGGRALDPEAVVQQALAHASVGVAYTYNEPLIGIEFVGDCARLARERGLANVLVTNGYVNPEPASELLPWIDALNIDLKSMDDAFYRKRCRGAVEPVKAFAVQAIRAGCHVEITNLIIPGLNDDDRLFESLAAWMKASLGEGVPLHFSAYHPDYHLEAPPTPVKTLQRAYGIARRHLRYVYMGNVMTSEGQNTLCPGCGATLIARAGYHTELRGIRAGVCGSCGRRAEVVMSRRA